MGQTDKTSAALPPSSWNAILSLLSPAYPNLTQEALKKKLDEVETDNETFEYVDTKEGCRMLHCTVQTLMRWARQGRIRYSKPSPMKVLYNLEDIKKVLLGLA